MLAPNSHRQYAIARHNGRVLNVVGSVVAWEVFWQAVREEMMVNAMATDDFRVRVRYEPGTHTQTGNFIFE